MEYPKIVVRVICESLREPDVTGVRSPSDMLRVLATIRGDLQFVVRAVTNVGSIYDDTVALRDRILAMPQLQEIELSKLNCNSVEVFRELADLIMQNKRLKSIIMQRTGMTDALASYLSEPLVRAQ